MLYFTGTAVAFKSWTNTLYTGFPESQCQSVEGLYASMPLWLLVDQNINILLQYKTVSLDTLMNCTWFLDSLI